MNYRRWDYLRIYIRIKVYIDTHCRCTHGQTIHIISIKCSARAHNIYIAQWFSIIALYYYITNVSGRLFVQNKLINKWPIKVSASAAHVREALRYAGHIIYIYHSMQSYIILCYIRIVNACVISGPIISRFMAHSDVLAPRDALNSCCDYNTFFIIIYTCRSDTNDILLWLFIYHNIVYVRRRSSTFVLYYNRYSNGSVWSGCFLYRWAAARSRERVPSFSATRILYKMRTIYYIM